MTVQIHSTDTSVVQVPTKDNDHHAIIQSTITISNGQTFTALGQAMAGSDPNTSEKQLLEEAEREGYDRALAMAEKNAILQPSSAGFQNSSSRPSRRELSYDNSSSRPHKNSGGGDKRASDKQKGCITSMCGCKGLDPDEYACSVVGAGMKDLSGFQADTIIKSLNSRQ